MQKNILEIKRQVGQLIGQNVDLKVNKGRKKIVQFNAIIEKVYPSMFVIKPNEEVELDRTSYSYNDIMCKDIIIQNIND